nr:hypothetical protein [uncultured Duganella sp.]
MKALCCALLLAAGACHGQTLDAPRRFDPVHPAPAAALDPAEAPMMAQPSTAGTFAHWYEQQRRPALALYFDKRLDQLPPGWQGATRLLIEQDGKTGQQPERKRLTIGVQHNTEAASATRGDFATLFEQSLQQEMRRHSLHLLDAVVLQRQLASAGRVEGADLEYISLNKAVRLILEVRLVCLAGGCDLLGTVKDIHSGAMTASARWPVDAALDSGERIDRASRALLLQLMKQKVP